MFQSIDETLNWIHERLPHGIKPGTERMKWVLEKLDHPERKMKTIHVGGTNGKGSTVSFLRHIYQAAGYKVGTFISPYITCFNERLMINGDYISDEDLIKATDIIYPYVQELDQSDLGAPTEFEVVTMISFVYFGILKPCDLVIYEVGLGGRLDSTNVIHPLVSVITNVGMDHMAQLGHTITEIAYEKAGIIKEGVAVVTSAEDEEAIQVIQDKAFEQKADLFLIGREFRTDKISHSYLEEILTFYSNLGDYRNIRIRMRGEHQIKNASLALMVVTYLNSKHHFYVNEENLRQGMLNTSWPGRFEMISENPLILIDGAHNIQGTEALVKALKRYYSHYRIHTIYSALKDKQYRDMIHDIESVSESIIFTTFDYPRAETAERLYQCSSHPVKCINNDWKASIQESVQKIEKGSVLLITGSLYFISQVRQFMK
ncbi:bifunctional folylpolyglutamate synthase/dihydrofolate synthase [Terrilactibacillus laevilacticus]|uniref:bifunctional folylpolyglutamate synthase/dihydrofolate synthase n=1 Tax=Terrilactibacillus laevilacticus TaxID=1380157 RepID=UPI001147420D|nr:folylpolyglutamate synthase/dihydrofolate synthase family protein [Terrilactibacillus laevilacticus]